MIAAAIVLSALVQAPMTFTTIEQGPLSGIDTRREVVVRSDAEWLALWQEHNANRAQPRVDFARSMVIGVFMGSRRTSGYAIEITRVERTGDGLTVFYRQTAPPPDAMTAQVLTSPFHIISVGRVPGTVRFETDAADRR